MIAKFNLAPEVYQAHQRNKQLRRTATTLGITINVIAIGLVILGLVVLGGQKIAISALTGQIQSRQNQVKTYSDLPNAVTIQQHLTSLKQLSSQQVYFSSFFKVLQNVLPNDVTADSVTVGNNNTLEVSGTAPSYSEVTKLAKALQAYNISIGPGAAATQQPFFTNVNLGSVSMGSSAGAPGNNVSYKIDTQMSPEVTSSAQ